MEVRRVHAWIGILLLLPLLGWAATGLVFFIKPGYAGAYQVLTPKMYPVDHDITVKPAPEWLEYRYFRTVLGEHLLARTEDGWRHLDPANLKPRATATDAQLRALLVDAFSADPKRYGNIVQVSGGPCAHRHRC